MAIDVKKMLAEALLQCCEKQSLKSVTIKDLLVATGISRQSFYNHLLDKNDLIQYVYDTYIVPDFDGKQAQMDFYESLLKTFQNIQKYHRFMKQACMMEGQNCLKDHIYTHCRDFDLKWHQALYGDVPMPEALRFATIYHATASSSMTLSWILSDMPVSCEEICQMIVEMRNLGMDHLFKDSANQENPYKKVDKKG